MASKCSRFYSKSGMVAFVPFPKSPLRYFLKTKPNMQVRQEIRADNQVRDLRANYLRRCVRRGNLQRGKRCDHYRTLSCFTFLRPYPTSNNDRKLGNQTKCSCRAGTIGANVFVVLPSFRPANFATVIERDQVSPT